MSGGRPVQTTPAAWAAAALDELEAVGARGLSAQGVARRLGVSKGGIYHHFADRRALLQAALALWEERHVDGTSARFAAIADPRERLHALLVYAALEMQPTVILQLMAAVGDPDVDAVLERSVAVRLGLLRRTFRQLGATRAQAEHRAVMAYAHYLGLAQLRAQSPEVVATPARVRAQVRELERALLLDL